MWYFGIEVVIVVKDAETIDKKKKTKRKKGHITEVTHVSAYA
jgi:hypothetical protein